MLGVTNFRVRSFDLDHLSLWWEAVPGEDPLDYTFQVLKSEAEYGPYTPVSRVFTDRYHFRDTASLQKHLYRRWYYKLRITRLSDSKTLDYPSGRGVALEAEPDLEALEIARQENIKLKEFKGRLVWVFPVRTSGTSCTFCTDPFTQEQIRSNCLSCFDTKIVGGYHTPLQIHMEIITPLESTRFTNTFETQQQNTVGKLANYPTMRERFVVVEAENVRWKVAGPIRRISKLRATVRQEFGLHALSRDDVAYKLPIKTSVSTLKASPERQFVLPHDPDGAPSVSISPEEEYGALLTSLQAQSSTGVTTVGETRTLFAMAQNASTTAGSGVVIDKSSLVSFVGSGAPNADRGGVLASDATGHVDPLNDANQLSDFYGVAAEQINPSKEGKIVRLGRTQIKKPAGEIWITGDPIYLSTTSGAGSTNFPVAQGTWVRLIGYAAEDSTSALGMVDLAPEAKIQNP